MTNYTETEQTYQALLNLKSVNNFVSFKMIFEEVQKIRLSKSLKPNPSNLKGRVRRSLTNDKKTFEVNSSVQSNELSIAKKYPEYTVESKNNITFNQKGLAIDINEVEENSFCLQKK